MAADIEKQLLIRIGAALFQPRATVRVEHKSGTDLHVNSNNNLTSV